MKKRFTFGLAFLLCALAGFSQNVGIKTDTPNSSLEVAGSVSTSILRVSGSIVLNDQMHTLVLIGSTQLALPVASSCTGRIYVILNRSGGNAQISSYRDEINGSRTIIPSATTLWIQSDGTFWQQIK